MGPSTSIEGQRGETNTLYDLKSRVSRLWQASKVVFVRSRFPTPPPTRQLFPSQQSTPTMSTSLVQRPKTISPVDILVFVTSAIPLPTDTLRALRLTCQATRLAIDDKIKELFFTSDDAEELRTVSSPLNLGVTSITLQGSRGPSLSVLAVSKVCLVASRNAEHLEILKMLGFILPIYDSNCAGPQATLGAVAWPRLTSLTIDCCPGIFETYINIDSMPCLTELILEGDVSAGDLVALRRGAHFASTIEALYVSNCPSEKFIDAEEFFGAFGDLIAAAPRLCWLKFWEGGGLSFLNSAEMPNLEYLEMRRLEDGTSMRAFALKPRKRLKALVFSGWEQHSGLETLASELSTSFPALESLEICLLDTWDFLREIKHLKLTKLCLHAFDPGSDDFAALAAGLAGLPALEHLKISAEGDNGHLDVDVGGAYGILLAGPPLLRLRRLETGVVRDDSDSSLDALISLSHKIPHLEELVMRDGCISANGFVALAAAGRAGSWKRLKLFHIGILDEEMDDLEAGKDFCRTLVQEVWPGLEVKIRR